MEASQALTAGLATILRQTPPETHDGTWYSTWSNAMQHQWLMYGRLTPNILFRYTWPPILIEKGGAKKNTHADTDHVRHRVGSFLAAAKQAAQGDAVATGFRPWAPPLPRASNSNERILLPGPDPGSSSSPTPSHNGYLTPTLEAGSSAAWVTAAYMYKNLMLEGSWRPGERGDARVLC